MSTRWSLDRFQTFPLIGSQYGRNKQVPSGAENGLLAPEGNGPPAALPQSVAPQSTTEVTNPLQCFREACGSLFSDDNSWREHNRTCRVLTNRYRCVFTKCAENFASNSPDDFIRHQRTHRIWTCELGKGLFAFGKREKALKYASKAHKFEPPELRVREVWVATPPKNLRKDIRYHSSMGFDLGNILGQFEAEVFGGQNSAPIGPHDLGGIETNGGVPGSLPAAVFAYIAGQLNMLGNLLDHQLLTPNLSEYDQVIQALDMLRNKLYVQGKQEIGPGWNRSFGFSNHGPEENTTRAPPAFKGTETHPEIATLQSRGSPSTPLSNGVSSTHEHLLPDIGSEPEDDSDEDFDEVKENLEAGPTVEPQQEAHLEKDEQIKYFEAMQKCCIEAAFTFYQRHKTHLDSINDRGSKPLCVTAKKEPINNPTDLSLPHWTHLLRRLSDARGLRKEMVSRIESFNGDILPVDEIQHAFKKEKVKSDRDLLALIQLTRNFCWQLKDWDKCKDLDDLYGLVEKNIKTSKSIIRKDSQLQNRKQRPRYYSPKASEYDGIRNGHRPSATWPRLPPDAESES